MINLMKYIIGKSSRLNRCKFRLYFINIIDYLKLDRLDLISRLDWIELLTLNTGGQKGCFSIIHLSGLLLKIMNMIIMPVGDGQVGQVST